MEDAELTQLFSNARELHRVGRLHDAERAYRYVLQRAPRHGGTLNLLSVLYLQQGQFAAAVDLAQSAVAVNPGAAEYHYHLGLALANLGKTDDAYLAWNRATQLRADFAEAHNNIGVILQRRGQDLQALAAFDAAIKYQPSYADAHVNQGAALRTLGRHHEAIEAFQRAISLRPNDANAYNNLGGTLHILGRHAEAADAYRRAIALAPQFAEVYYNLGMTLRALGDLNSAIESYRNALAQKPQYPEALNNLAESLHTSGRFQEAIDACERAVNLRPQFPEAWFNLGNSLRESRSYERAIAAYRTAISQKPHYPEAHAGVAEVFREQSELAPAEDAVRHALALQGDSPDALVALGNVFQEQRKIDEAIEVYRRAILAAPQHAAAHFNLATCLLAKGKFEEGWKEFEWRWKFRRRELPSQSYQRPFWRGEPLNGQRILVYAEGGYGDTIRFARFLPRVAARGGIVTLACQPELRELLHSVEGVTQVVDISAPAPPFDTHVPLLSLPHILRLLSTEDLSMEHPYISASNEKVGQWRERLREYDGKRKIGLAWRGRAHPHRRSIPLPELQPLLKTPGTVFVSVQAEPPDSAMESDIISANGIRDVSSELRSFADTAALLQCLDVLITIDSAPAHLSGALANASYVVLKYAADWRWMTQGTHTYWYPSLHLFRQQIATLWMPVINELQLLITS